MMRPGPVCAGVIAALLCAGGASAQVTIDVAKITCDQLVLQKITDPQNIALWLSGYYHAKRNSTVIDTQKLTADAEKIKQYCLHKPDVTVMQAVEAVFTPQQ